MREVIKGVIKDTEWEKLVLKWFTDLGVQIKNPDGTIRNLHDILSDLGNVMYEEDADSQIKIKIRR